jgi:hypothetical protein
MFCEQYKPRILLLSETCITNEISNCEINVEGYKIYRCDSDSRHTGGLVIYAKSDINLQVISNCKKSLSWFLAFKILKGFTKGIYGLVYKSPRVIPAEFSTPSGRPPQILNILYGFERSIPRLTSGVLTRFDTIACSEKSPCQVNRIGDFLIFFC